MNFKKRTTGIRLRFENRVRRQKTCALDLIKKFVATLSVEFQCVVSTTVTTFRAIAVGSCQSRRRHRHTRTHQNHGTMAGLDHSSITQLHHARAHFIVDPHGSQAFWAHVPRKPPPFSKPNARKASHRAREAVSRQGRRLAVLLAHKGQAAKATTLRSPTVAVEKNPSRTVHLVE